MDDQEYLAPGFDASTLTMPRLRSILVAHNVNYPSSAKKSQLVDLVNDHVLSQARSIRSANARVKRTSRGIEDVPSSQSSVAENDDENKTVVAPQSTTSTRRSTRARTEEPQEVEPTPRRTRHSTAPPEDTPRTVSVKHQRSLADVQESEPEAKRPTSKRGRPSTAVTPATARQAEKDESPFSNDNVFQSGGSTSPPRASVSRDADRRRTTMNTTRSEAERRRSRERRRVSENVRPVSRDQPGGIVVPTRRTLEMPITRVKKEEPVIEPTEEFTPEESQELIRAEQSGELVPTPRRKARAPGSAAKVGPFAVLAVLLGGVATWWRQEKLAVGYCGVGGPSTDLIQGVQIPEWAEVIRPQCEPCPAHAYCGDQLETVCEQDFILTPHPLSFSGVVPLAPSCEPDSAKARKVNAVKERAVEELRQQNARFECGEASKPEVKETELKSIVSASKRKSMSDEEFEDLWAAAIPEIQNTEEVVSGSDGLGFTLRSTSLARLPLACSIRRSLRATLRRYLWQTLGVILLLSSGTYGRHRLITNKSTEEKAKHLASLALEKLSQQAALHAYDADAYRENYISVAQLRDDILRDEFSATRRKALWERVQKKVERNANVRPMVREGRSGDVGRVWEWVGAVGMLEGTPGSGDRRRSAGRPRVSFGGVTEERLIEARAEEDEGKEMVERYQEPRKYY